MLSYMPRLPMYVYSKVTDKPQMNLAVRADKQTVQIHDMGSKVRKMRGEPIYQTSDE